MRYHSNYSVDLKGEIPFYGKQSMNISLILLHPRGTFLAEGVKSGEVVTRDDARAGFLKRWLCLGQRTHLDALD